MFGKKKAAYQKPDLERIPLEESEVNAVVGGVSSKSKSKKKKTVEIGIDLGVDSITESTIADQMMPGDGGAGNGDVGQGRGRGGGCDGVAYHRNVRTFSSGRNSGC